MWLATTRLIAFEFQKKLASYFLAKNLQFQFVLMYLNNNKKKN